MDSGNSGSMQSSSTGGGGDEEYDSRAESISAFLNNPPPPPPPTSHVGPFTNINHPNPQHQHHHHNHTHMFDSLSNYLDPIQRSPNSLPNLDMVWSKAARSEPNPSDLGGLIPCSSSSSPHNQNQALILSSQPPGQTRGVAAFLTTQHHSLPQEVASRGALLSGSSANDQPHNSTNNANANTNMVRNPKKRSRASRRAPTTVLTTDTTNFRAMVQEFTGIPAPPFTSSSPFPRTRLDLFGSAASSAIRSHLDPQPPPYLLRPFAQKVQPFPPSASSIPYSSSSIVDTLASNNSTNNSSTNNSTSINYQLYSSSSADHLGLLKQQPQPLDVNNMHNPILTFQSILQQAPPKYPLGGTSSLLASKTQPSLEIPPTSVDSHLKMGGVLEELGLSHAHVSAHVGGTTGLHHNMVLSSSDRALSRVNNNNNNNMRNPSADWVQRTGTITNNDGDHGGVLRSLSGTGNYGSNVPERVSNGKVNYSASPSDFHGEKGARSEGMVESWINCSSD